MAYSDQIRQTLGLELEQIRNAGTYNCLLYTSPSPRDPE